MRRRPPPLSLLMRPSQISQIILSPTIAAESHATMPRITDEIDDSHIISDTNTPHWLLPDYRVTAVRKIATDTPAVGQPSFQPPH